jgi:hypothetical protein
MSLRSDKTSLFLNSVAQDIRMDFQPSALIDHVAMILVP